MFGRQLPQWFGRPGMAPPVDPSLVGMLPQVQPQTAQPQAQFTPVAAPQAPVAQIGPDREAAMRQQMLAETMGKQYGDRSNVTSPLTAGLYALNQGLGSFLDKRAAESKAKVESSDRKALIDALNSADPMGALGGLESEAAQNAFIQMKLGQMNQKPSERWNNIDINGDGLPDYQESSTTGERKLVQAPDLTFEQKRQLAREGRASTTVNVGGGGTDKQIYETLGASYEQARPAVGGLGALREAEKALEGPGVYGQFANERLALQKIGAMFGADPTAITNTETFRSAIAPTIAAIMKATVGSTQISNADREFAEKAAGGSITLDKNSIKRVLSITRKASEGLIKGHQERLDAVYPQTPDNRFYRERALFGIKTPPAYAPPNPADRTRGTVYETPKGPMTWTGTGWVPAQ